MIETCNKVGTEGNFLNILKAIYEKPTMNVILNDERFSSEFRNTGRMSAFATSIQHSTGSSRLNN